MHIWVCVMTTLWCMRNNTVMGTKRLRCHFKFQNETICDGTCLAALVAATAQEMKVPSLNGPEAPTIQK